MTAADRAIFEYQDVANASLRSQNWTAASASLAALETALQAATNSNLTYVTSGQPVVGSTTPTDALYQSVQDVLIISLMTAIPSYVQVTLPAPVGTMFLPGGVVIDPANTTWVALLAAIIAVVTDVAGNPVVALVSAVKSSRRSDQYSG